MQRTEIIKTIDLTKEDKKEVKLCGWVDARRDHGQVIFIDLRDRSGKVQVVLTKEQGDMLRPEWVVELIGEVKARPTAQINEKEPTGKIEVEAKDIKILAKARTPIFEINDDKVSEDLKMQYRYLDLRGEKMRNVLELRHRTIKFIRDFLDSQGFWEVETPILTKSTPEGARDYVVPSRVQPGKFYALPQSPQQYKQLLMSGGVEKYFQIARCFRDEDTRGDRQPEFTQMDMEMSFVEEGDIININERLLIELIQKTAPEKKIQEVPFPRFSFKEVMEKYGIDRPDLRKDKADKDLLAFCWVVDWPFFERSEEANKWTFSHNPFSRPKEKYMPDLLVKKNIGSILTSQYDVVLNGSEIGSGGIRNHEPEALQKVFEILGYSEKNIKEQFGHMLGAFASGTPPHGGIAWGLDRLVMILTGGESIREVIAFPKTGDGRDLLMSSPSEISEEQLKELGLRINLPLTKGEK